MIKASLQEFCAALTDNHPILGIDYGSKKIGFAISDPSRNIAMPLEVAFFKGEKPKLEYIQILIERHKICGMVIGIPMNMDGSSSDQSKAVEKFVGKLAGKSELPIFFQDERLSTSTAHSLLKSVGIKRKARDSLDDQVAASLILETVIDSMRLL